MIKFLKIMIIVATFGMTACQSNVAYYNYESVAAEGWDKQDTLFFHIDSIAQPGSYDIILCLRTSQEFPYRTLSAKAVEKMLHQGTVNKFNVTTSVMDDEGAPTGQGITLFSREVLINTITIDSCDSMLIQVRHDMRRETMPGVSDVGIKLVRKD